METEGKQAYGKGPNDPEERRRKSMIKETRPGKA
jgi:hypothetical protein